MKETSGGISLQDGKKVFTKTWLPDGSIPKGNIILAHGLGEHCDRYQHVADWLTAHNYALYAFDHIGHGQSDGKRGATNYAQAWEIINRIKKQLISQYPNIPIFGYGHSLGGGIILSYGFRFPENLRGVVATSPAIGMTKDFSPIQVQALRFLSKLIPDFAIANGLKLEGLSQDKEVIRKYQADPLVHDRVSLKLGLDIYEQGKATLENKNPFPVPLLALQGAKDELVNPTATEQFALNNSGKIVFQKYADGLHELHNEPFKEQVFQLMTNWLDGLS